MKSTTQQHVQSWRRFLVVVCSIWSLSAFAGGGLQCTCPTARDEPFTQTEPLSLPEPDASERELPFECPALLDKPCKTDDDCLPPQQPKPKKPACPMLYCGEAATHARTTPVDPYKPGSSKWDPAFYPKRDECECRTECARYKCIGGICKNPNDEPPVEPIPPPDLPPSCPLNCQKDTDCPARLCADRTVCDNESKRCINPLTRP